MLTQRQIAVMLAAVCLCISLAGCSQSAAVMKDGYYTAIGAEFDSHGWKEYVTVYVSNNQIVSLDYDARDASGYIKSWDMSYMRNMNRVSGTYPNFYVRSYKTAMLNRQRVDEIDAVSGATASFHAFRLLVEAAVDHAYAGDKRIAEVDLSSTEHKEIPS